MRNIEYTLALRWVIGWTYFSAFWRRVALTNKLDPEMANYIGIKFNHFLPNALGIKPLIEQLLLNPDQLHLAMVVFTIIEGLVGLFLILGLFTRLASIGVAGLAFGILLGSGWIGTTCLDEWQIGVLGIAGGMSLFFLGSRQYSIDVWMANKGIKLTRHKTWPWLGSGNLPLSNTPTIVLITAVGALLLTLFTNQVFHNGIWGNLHNKSVKPKIKMHDVQFNNDTITFDVQRVEGVDVYGSFIVEILVQNYQGKVIQKLSSQDLSQYDESLISNKYIAKIHPGERSLIFPLGAYATIKLPIQANSEPKVLTLYDVSGKSWSAMIE